MNNNINNITQNNAGVIGKFETYETGVAICIPVVQFIGIPRGTSSSSPQNSSNLSHISNVNNMDLGQSESTISNTSSLLFPENDCTNNSIVAGDYTDESNNMSFTNNDDITMSTGYTVSIHTDTYDGMTVESFEDDEELDCEKFECDDDENEIIHTANPLFLLNSNVLIPVH